MPFRGEGERSQLVGQERMDGERIAIDHRHRGVQVHEGPLARQLHGDHAVDLVLGEQSPAVSTPWGVDRSPIPLITARLPMTVTSPPSIVAGSCASESLP